MANPAKHIPVLGTTEDKGLVIKPFRFLTTNSATTVPHQYITYRPPKLVKGKARWYVEYWYRVPEALYHGKDWQRFRVFEDINRFKNDEYADMLLAAVKKQLQNGYNPFKDEQRAVSSSVKVAVLSLNTGLDRFIDHCQNKGLRKKSIQSYGIVINFLREYFTAKGKLYNALTSFTRQELQAYIFDLRKQKGWNNATTNNYIRFTKTVFNWFVKEEYLDKNPALPIEELAVTVNKHKYYSDAVADKMKRAIEKVDPELYEFIQFIYYTATRPKSEARLLQVKHILFDRKMIFVPGQISKNKCDDYISVSDDLLELFSNRKDQPKDNYIFGGPKCRSQNYFANHYKPFKDKFGLSEDYTIYSWKHTRAIHLAEAGADPYQIMKLFRHSGLDVTMKYLRDLGCEVSQEVHSKTKKF